MDGNGLSPSECGQAPAQPQEPPTSESFITKGVNSYFYLVFSHELLLVAKIIPH